MMFVLYVYFSFYYGVSIVLEFLILRFWSGVRVLLFLEAFKTMLIIRNYGFGGKDIVFCGLEL